METNCRNHHAYRRKLAGIPGLTLLEYDEAEESNFQYVVAEVDVEAAGLTRDELVAVLTAENVLARRYFYPGCHRMEPYRSYFPLAGLVLPETENVCRRVMVLPTGTSIDEPTISRICAIIHTAISNASAVKVRLSGAEVAVRSAS